MPRKATQSSHGQGATDGSERSWGVRDFLEEVDSTNTGLSADIVALEDGSIFIFLLVLWPLVIFIAQDAKDSAHHDLLLGGVIDQVLELTDRGLIPSAAATMSGQFLIPGCNGLG